MQTSKHTVIRGLLLFLVLLSSCNKEEPSSKPKSCPIELEEEAYIILRLGDGYFSNAFRKLSSKQKIYSHVGIVYRCDSTSKHFKVYHIEANEFTGQGGLKNESLETFLSHSKYWSIYSINASDSLKTEIVNQAACYDARGVEFDLEFDLESDDKLYCAELVGKAINHALGYPAIKADLQISGKTFIGLDDIYLNDLCKHLYSKDK